MCNYADDYNFAIIILKAMLMMTIIHYPIYSYADDENYSIILFIVMLMMKNLCYYMLI